MRLLIKLLCIILFMTNGLLQAQESSADSVSQNSKEDKIEIPKRLFLTDLYLQRGNPSGDNFAGNGLKGGAGFGIRMQFYLPKNIYIGGSLTQDYMSVSNTAVVGEYSRATKFNAYLFAGYDYRINDNFSILGDVGYGYSQNKNRQNSSQGSGKFRDSGNVFRITTSIEYHLNNSISFFMSPSFEMVSYNIKTPTALSDDFENGNYFNIAFGIRLSSRDYRDIEIKGSENEDLKELQGRDRDDLSIKEKRRLYFLKKKEERRLRRERRRRN
ncbi:outer membrane protein [Nonlabens sp.]|uniref:outer membrane protein n=1 Tax=Nonlabens sp. TaxID=1888209 RepID=UPI003F698B49